MSDNMLNQNPLQCVLTTEFADAVNLVKEAFKAEGFGVLTEIDVQKTLADKIGTSIAPYHILGVCNPHLASRAIAVQHDIGLFLPCNVLISQVGDEIEVVAQDPSLMVKMTGNTELEPIALEAHSRIARAIAAMRS